MTAGFDPSLHAVPVAPTFSPVGGGATTRERPRRAIDTAAASPTRIWHDLRLSRPGDGGERAADAVADQALRGAGPVDATTARRRGSAAVAAPTELGRGTRLDPAVRAGFERAFGFDFANVRIYADDAAAQSAHEVGASAYTVGEHVVFGAGRYLPETTAGRALLAHELAHVVQQACGGGVQLQRRDDGTSDPLATAIADVRAQLAALDRQWSWVKSVASDSKTAAPWLTAGNTVAGLIHNHIDAAIAALTSHDTSLVRQYRAVLETDLLAFRYVAWHAFAYQNIDRTRSWVSALVDSFNADDRKFTGRKLAEDGARALKKLADGIATDSAAELSLLTTDVPYKLTTGGGTEVAITLTSAGDKKRRAAMETEIEQITKVEGGVELTVANLNAFVATARHEGLAQAVDALEQYYRVKQFLDAGKGGKNDKQQQPNKDEEKTAQPDVDPVPPVVPQPEEGDGGRWGCDDVRCNVYPVEKGAKCPDRVIGSSRNHPSFAAACLAAQRNANAQVPRGCNKRHCNCNGKCRKM
jgi:hypothetical protein